MSLSIVILAAGEGKRMHSRIPKVLHRLASKPLLQRVVETAHVLPKSQIYVVYGYAGDQVKGALSHLPVTWVEQKERLGTGHALLQVMPYLPNQGQALVLYGDVPLIRVGTLLALTQMVDTNSLGLLVAKMPEPDGFGRILRDSEGQVLQIIEEKDADEAQKRINEIYTGILIAPISFLRQQLPKLGNANAQKEYYLTDVIKAAVEASLSIKTLEAPDWQEVLGVNDRIQLAFLERYYQQQQVKRWMLAGITFLDPDRVDLRGDVQLGQDCVIDIDVILEDVTLGAGCYVGPYNIVRNSTLGDNVQIHASSIIEGATVKEDSQIGPFARIRPTTLLAAKTRIGNFVEVKNAAFGEESKALHLSYIGDATIGQRVNIGAGTITCNYDGIHKHHTVIKDGAFIGSDSQLVAPLVIGESATIGAGSTITKDVPADSLALSRAKQVSISGWQRKDKQRE